MKTFLMLEILTVFILLTNNSLISQVSLEWVDRFDGFENSIDGGKYILFDNFDNIIVGGVSYNSFNNSDFTIIKYSKYGNRIRVSNFDGGDNDYLNEMKVSKNGDIYVTGQSRETGNREQFDYLTIKFDTSGFKQWESKYDGTSNLNDESFDIALDSSGNIYVTGFSTDFKTNRDCVTIKYNSYGQLMWIQKYDHSHLNDEGWAIGTDKNNNVYVAGFSGDSLSSDDFFLVKYDSSGNQIWVERYNGTGNTRDFCQHLVLDDSANIYISGYTTSLNTGADYTTIKYNSSGILQWVQKYDGSQGSDVVRSIAIDRESNIYVTGSSIGQGTGYDYATIKYNSNGIQQWVSRYNNGSTDLGFCIAVGEEGSVYVSGGSKGSITDYDYATVKYNSSGQQQWIQRYDYSGEFGDIAKSIIVDTYGSLYITGTSDRDIQTLKYSQLTGLITNPTETPSDFSLSQNYPNPFNPKTIINYQLSMFNFVSIKVYDVLGNEVASLVNGKQNAGYYSVEFDGSGFASGVYFYKLEAGEFSETKRMVILK